MRLHLQHIGPLREAAIDLAHDFILLTGPNGTGKTFAAYCVYGIGAYQKDTDLKRNSIYSTALTEQGKVSGLYSDLIIDYINQLAEQIKKNLFNTFGEPKEMIDLAKAHLSITLDENERSYIYNTVAKFGYVSFRLGDHSFKIEQGVLFINKDKHTEVDYGKFSANHILASVIKTYSNLFTHQSNYHIFPIERVVLSALFQSFKPESIAQNIQRYSLPFRDHLAMHNDFIYLSKNTSEFAYLADYLEAELLKGKITMSQYGELRYKPTGDKKNYSIGASASITKSLASLVFYFRHLAKAGDRIIIDEPELNLHPDNQRIIARFLVRAMNAGVKILISTHSDHLIRELNNLMMLGSKRDDKKAKKLMREYKYKPEDLLDYTKVGAYLFLGDTCEQLEVEETGFEVATIDAAISAQNEASDMIYFTLFD
jgi:AAA domain, putative AbiEii toxin, Type IV TA system